MSLLQQPFSPLLFWLCCFVFLCISEREMSVLALNPYKLRSLNLICTIIAGMICQRIKPSQTPALGISKARNKCQYRPSSFLVQIWSSCHSTLWFLPRHHFPSTTHLSPTSLTFPPQVSSPRTYEQTNVAPTPKLRVAVLPSPWLPFLSPLHDQKGLPIS